VGLVSAPRKPAAGVADRGSGSGADLAGGDAEVAGRGGQTTVAEQQLDGAHVGASLQQVRGSRTR